MRQARLRAGGLAVLGEQREPVAHARAHAGHQAAAAADEVLVGAAGVGHVGHVQVGAVVVLVVDAGLAGQAAVAGGDLAAQRELVVQAVAPAHAEAVVLQPRAGAPQRLLREAVGAPAVAAGVLQLHGRVGALARHGLRGGQRRAGDERVAGLVVVAQAQAQLPVRRQGQAYCASSTLLL
jgi:hypothetical protein